jgi:hypothetical protein
MHDKEFVDQKKSHTSDEFFRNIMDGVALMWNNHESMRKATRAVLTLMVPCGPAATTALYVVPSATVLRACNCHLVHERTVVITPVNLLNFLLASQLDLSSFRSLIDFYLKTHGKYPSDFHSGSSSWVCTVVSI